MGAKAYTRAQMNYAVALAVRIGAEATATRLGMQPRTVRRWCERAGTAPADAIVGADWSSLGAMARAQVDADLTSGKLTTVQAATVAAIADRNAAKPDPVTEPVTVEEAWMDAIEAAVLRHHKGHAAVAMVALIEWFDALDPDGPAPTIQECLDHLEGLGDLSAWHAARAAATHEAMLVQLERNRAIAAEWTRNALDAETQALLAEAEAWLAAHTESAP